MSVEIVIRLRGHILAEITTNLMVFSVETFSLGVRLFRKMKFYRETEE